jgi:isopentenyl diphosphate isomerase/L-lactate dehydrogenase-like FMN-dependent dehydrogenase
MIFDEILLIAVLVMLIASTSMAWSMQLSMRRSREALEALVKQIGEVGLANLNHDQRIERLEHRVEELEK